MKHLLSFILIASLSVCSMNLAIAQTQTCNASLCGFVTDSKTKKPIAFAEVMIEETGVGVTTDEFGKFHIHNICDGDYTVVSRHIGCPHVAKKITIKGNVEVDFQLSHEALDLQQIVVLETSIIPHHIQSQHELGGRMLDSKKGKSFSAMLDIVPGVSLLTTGANISKPVIHGSHSNRVLVINDGVRHESQQWGLEHGLEIDAYSADKVTLVMGANSVRYGADALGGVIIVEPEALRKVKGIGGEIHLAGASKGRMGAMSGVLTGNSGGKLPISTRVQGTLKRAGNLKSPDYFLENTGLAEHNYLIAAGLQKGKFEAEISYSRFFSRIGIFEGAHAEGLDELYEAIQRGRPELDGEFSYQLEGPLQQAEHGILKAKGKIHLDKIGALSMQLARQDNKRQEFEGEHGQAVDFDHPEARFDMKSHSFDLILDHKPWKNLRGAIGIQYMNQDNNTVAGELIPDYKSSTTGIFWLERWKKYPLPVELEAGLRFDSRKLNVGERAGTPIDDVLEYNNLTATMGAIYRFPKFAELSLSTGSAWRSPSLNELYSDGVHEGTASYEIGRNDLIPEREYSISLNLKLKLPADSPNLQANLTLFNNWVNNYIYLQPQSEPVVIDEGAFPAFRFEQADANIRGMDLDVQYNPIPSLKITSGMSWLQTRNMITDEPLALMPANRLRHSLTWYPETKQNESRNTYLRVSLLNVAKQKNIPENLELAPAPDAYHLIGFELGTVFTLAKQEISAGFSVDNMLNTKYREYMNRLRYFADEPGRSLSVNLKWEF